ncbi:hypothetical protein ACN9M0_35385 [Streptomyces sp. R-07]|uniref:hypothetical protein n=1 Tax=Streptomyces sp. R-07 TaxID=3404052 RepID=UPI003CF80269
MPWIRVSLLHGFAIGRSRSAVTLGTRAAELLLEETGDQADDHRHDQVVLRPELVVRRSSLTPCWPDLPVREPRCTSR